MLEKATTNVKAPKYNDFTKVRLWIFLVKSPKPVTFTYTNQFQLSVFIVFWRGGGGMII